MFRPIEANTTLKMSNIYPLIKTILHHAAYLISHEEYEKSLN